LIKYIGSKRLLVPVLGEIARALSPSTALDLFTGTTRVAQEFKRQGIQVTAVDTASYAETLARCFIETDADTIDTFEVAEALRHLNSLPGRVGYFTEVFCQQARYLQPFNGQRVDAIRDCLEAEYRDTKLYPVLLTALLLAADRVDSTAGVQMSYLKQWAPRSFRTLELRLPALLSGAGTAVRADASEVAESAPPVDLAYLDPPYNQHRYFTNYHVWETLVRWDAPDYYGVACKRLDARGESTRSAFNAKRKMPGALESLIRRTRARVVVVSYNDESWIQPDQLVSWLVDAGHEQVRLLAFDSKRYVGAQIGIYSPAGHKVGTVGRLRNTEYLFVAGDAAAMDEIARADLGAIGLPVPGMTFDTAD
jgi:adenine-specific DNA-methyltransferase